MENSSQKFVVDRFEGKFAVLRGDDELEINWPKRDLPKGAQEGSVIVLRAIDAKGDRAAREKTAKELLREILKDN